MPTYTFKYSNLTLNKKKKFKLAKAVTKIHSDVTGANTYFAQVIFEQNKKEDHYIGGKKVRTPEIFLFGNIRSGRSKKIKKRLIVNMRESIKKILKLDQDNIWIYILDILPSQMMEYGELLPNSGKEKNWFNKLSQKLKIRLSKLEGS